MNSPLFKGSIIKPLQKKDEPEDWLMSYADMITLLMTFFILILSMTRLDPVKFEKITGDIAKDIGYRKSFHPMDDIHNDLHLLMKKLNLEDSQYSIGVDNRGLVFDLSSQVIFTPTKALLTNESKRYLSELALRLNSPRYSSLLIEIQGHSDNQENDPDVFPSHWELSAARAASVAHFMVDNGINPIRIIAVGLADTQPKKPNFDRDNNPIISNQSANRRVSIHLYPN